MLCLEKEDDKLRIILVMASVHEEITVLFSTNSTNWPTAAQRDR